MSSDEFPDLAHMSISDASFEPLDPYGSIAVLYQSPERRKVAGAWNFGPGGFDYELPYDLFVYVIEGRTSVDVQGQDRVELASGDIAYFTSGQTTRWEAPEEIRTVFFCVSDQEPIDIYAV
jgi:uncharacterized cupin superfamily protein